MLSLLIKLPLINGRTPLTRAILMVRIFNGLLRS